MSLRSIEFHFVEAMTNIRRNGLMSISAVTNSAACLFVLGAFLVGWWNLARLHQRVASETRVLVFMRSGVGVDKAEAAAVALAERLPRVIKSYKIVTPEEGLNRVCQSLGIQPDEALRKRNPVPASIEIELARPQEYGVVVEAASDSELVDEVRAGQKVLENLMALKRLGMAVGAALVFLLGAAALLTISNTIRLTIYARRREIDIMQLVGATQSFIRAPFTLEGMFHGVAGATVGGAILIASYVNLRLWVTSDQSLLPFLESLLSVGTVSDLALCWGVLLAAGAAFGAMGSWLSVTRYLHA